MASGQMPESRLMRRLIELRLTLKARARALFAHAPVNGAADHVMLLDGGKPVDPVVVAVGFVIFGKQASHLVQAQFFESQYAQMAVK
jgi:hypothetical protein